MHQKHIELSWFKNIWQSLFGFETWHDEDGREQFFTLDPNADFSDYSSDVRKIVAVFTNPAVLKVFKLQCDTFSLGKFYVYDEDKEVKNDPLLRTLSSPQPFQQTSQWLWDFMFWKMIGNAYLYVDSDSPTSDTNKLYWLEASKITWPDTLIKYKDKIVLSDKALQEINDAVLTYTYDDGSTFRFKWSRVTHVSDLTNGTGNWFKGRSTIDTLYEIISNSRASVRSKNINVRYTGKYMVAGKTDVDNINEMPLGEPEKRDIERQANGTKAVTAVKSMIDIKRFIERADVIKQLDDSYLSDYFKIGTLWGIPRDVLEASLEGSTYENQEKSTGRQVEYTLIPAGEALCNPLSKRFGYTTKKLVISWDHLGFMQVFEKDRAETAKIKSETLLNLMKANVSVDNINRILDTNFEANELDYEPAKRTNQNTNNGTNQNSNQSGN